MNDFESFFDEHGRMIPLSHKYPVHKKTRRYFNIQPVEINYEKIFNKIKSFLDPSTSLSLNDFKSKAENIINKLSEDKKLSNITKGVGVPFFMPKRKHKDVGEELSKNYLTALKNSFKDENPNFDFINHCSDNLTESINVNNKSRHDKFIEKLENELVVGYYFPAMLEYSFEAAIDNLNSLPDNFYLAGGFDTCAAFIGTPNLLLNKNSYPPLLWMTSLKTDKEKIGYHIESYGYNLTFNKRPHLGNVAEYWAHSLIVL